MDSAYSLEGPPDAYCVAARIQCLEDENRRPIRTHLQGPVLGSVPYITEFGGEPHSATLYGCMRCRAVYWESTP